MNKRFACTRSEASADYAEEIEAESSDEAKRICDSNGWRFDGEIISEADYGQNNPPPSILVH